MVITRRWVATDLCGNATTNSYVITVNDTNAPSISGVPANQYFACLSDIPPLPTVTPADNCGTPALVHTGSTNGSCPTIITRRWVATDACNNSVTNSYVITVHDTNAPTVTQATTNKTVECGTAWVFNPPSFADNCGTVNVTNSTSTNATCGNAFVATRIWFARDLCNNLTTRTQVVDVVDTTPPLVSCPTNKMVECTAVWTFDPPLTSSDICGTNRTEIIATSTNGTCGNGFIALRTWRITDACGNFSTCQQTVTVQDTTPPVIICPSNITVQCDSLVPSPDPLGIIASDTCGAVTNKVWVRDSRVTNGCMVTISRRYRATDACGNQAQCDQTITVLDTIPPVITCSSNRTIECGTAWQFIAPQASDNCQLVTVTNVLRYTNATCGNTFVASAVWQAIDKCDNSSLCTNTVTIMDSTPPVVVWFANKTNLCTQPVVFNPPTNITDTCSSTFTVVMTVSNLVTTDGLNRLVQTRCWRVYDACSNFVENCQSVTVENCAVEYCSLTQGAYGNSGGKFNGIPRPTLIQGLLTVPGTQTNSWDIVLGKPGRSMRFTRASVACIIQRLPAGGPAAAFPDFGNTTLLPDLCQTTPPMPMDRKGTKFRNILFGQGLTLNLNTRLSTNLLSLVLTNPVSGNRICTFGALPGPDGKIGTSDDELDTKGPDGIELNGDESKSWTFPSSVINTLRADPTLGVTGQGLIELVNRALAGQPTGSATLSDISGAAGVINEAFDECRFLVPCQQ
jgi:hypothetical protein